MHVKNHSHFAVVLVAMIALACGDKEQTDCNDGLDNDGDGFIDLQDPGCPMNDNKLEKPDPKQCADKVDNDGDGKVDLADPGCESADDDAETDPIRACNDGADNDNDAITDFPNDPGCDTPVDNDEYNPPACNDAVDNDSDGKMDYPYDPGCDSAEDADETDTGTKACSDGMDNDNDEKVDYPNDPGCLSAADDNEHNNVAGACGPTVVITDITAEGATTGSVMSAMPNELQSPSCNGYGGETAFTYTVTQGPKALIISTDHPETTLDTVVYLRSECRQSETELGCDDDSGDVGAAGRSSRLVLEQVLDGTYYIIVDSFGPGSLGDFKLTVEVRTGLGGACDPNDPKACVDGLICRPASDGAPSTCEKHLCGDGLDNDGDGDTDFPYDCGCTTPDGDDETDPGVLPACCDGADNDMDTLADFPADPGCEAAADQVELDQCYPDKPVAYLDLVTGTTGSTVGETDKAEGTCGGGSGPEEIYAVMATMPLRSLTLSTDHEETSLDSVLYVREGVCDSGAEVACSDNISFSNTRSTVTFAPTMGSTYFVFVDSGWGASGAYRLTTSGIIAGGGACDPDDAVFVCDAGYLCEGTCRPTACNDGMDNDGDGRMDYPNEPGCASIKDDDETDPDPLPQCSDGMDNDMDGTSDYPADSSCQSAGDDDEACASFGTNTFGYTGCQDTLGATPPCEDISTTGTVVCTGDDCTDSVTLPFTFSYYGVERTSLSIAANGKIGFPAESTFENMCVVEDDTIAIFWDDLNPSIAGSLKYQTFGEEPNRHITVQWNIPHISGTAGPYDIRAVLYEGSNDIVACYIDTDTGEEWDHGVSATVGIAGPMSDMLLFSCKEPVVTNGLLLRFNAP